MPSSYPACYCTSFSSALESSEYLRLDNDLFELAAGRFDESIVRCFRFALENAKRPRNTLLTQQVVSNSSLVKHTVAIA